MEYEKVIEQLSSHKIDKKTIRSYFVYALWDKDEIVYIGKSVRLQSRIDQHAGSSKEFTHFSFIELENEQEMDAVETKLIFELQPKYNTIAQNYISISTIRERIRKMNVEYKYSEEFYVKKIKQKLIGNGIKIWRYKDRECVRADDLPLVFKTLLGGS